MAELPSTKGTESREEIIARVAREQSVLNPTPQYSERSKRRLKVFLTATGPLGVAIGWAMGAWLGWPFLAWFGFGVGLAISFAYLGFVFVAERDDGRINRRVRRLTQEAAVTATEAGEP